MEIRQSQHTNMTFWSPLCQTLLFSKRSAEVIDRSEKGKDARTREDMLQGLEAGT